MRASPWLAALLLLLPGRPGAAQESDSSASKGKLTVSGEAVVSALVPTDGESEREAEWFWAGVSASYAKGSWGVEAEVRGRDGRFRPYFDGSVWLERGGAFVELPREIGTLRVGKVSSVAALPDRTFGGNLLTLNGVDRNPEWGASLSGSRRLGWNEISWAARWAGRNDHVAWEEQGRGVESEEGAKLLDGFEARVGYLLNKGLVTVRPALFGATARIVPASGEGFQRSDAGAELRATVGPISLETIGFWRDGDPEAARAGGRPGDPRVAYDEGFAWLLAVDAEFPTVRYRYVYSEWQYRGTDGNERIHQPGVVWTPMKGIEASVEYSARRRRNLGAVQTSNGIRLGLTARF